jgi:hypothetical protein
MPDLIESSEFGDWLIGEISARSDQTDSALSDRTPPASQQLEELKIAKKVLHEFLSLQRVMLSTASASRETRSS